MRLLIIAATAAILQSCAGAGVDTSPREVRIALSRDAITWLPVHLAQSLGYLRDEGVTLTVSDVAGMSKGAEALVGGSVDVTGGNPTVALQLNAEGRAVQSFVMLSSRPNLAIVATPQSAIRNVADLKGRRVGISSAGSPTQLFLNYLLTLHGLLPEDVTTVSIGAGASSVAALEYGRVDAASLVGSAITTIARRYPELTMLADARTPEGAQALFGTPTFPSASLLAETSWLTEHADTAHRFVRAIKKAMTWMREHSAEEVLAQIPEPLRMPDSGADVESIRDSQRALSADGTMPADGAETVRKVLAASNEKVRVLSFDLSTIYTNAFAAAR